MAQKKTQSRSSSKKKTSTRSSSGSGSAKLLKMLKDDHQKVMDLFEEAEENSSDGQAQELFGQIQKELQVHMEGEEKFLYPVLVENDESRELTLEAYEEHGVAKNLMKQFGRQTPGDERWMAKMKVLKEIIEHHVKEEEREMFKMARKVLDAEQSEAIMQRLETAKEKAGVLSFVIEGVHAHDVGTILDREGIAVRAGHHCAQPVMQHFGLPATTRASFAMYNTRAEVDALAAGIERVSEVFA